MHKFYIRMDGDIFGPYTAKGMKELDVMPDIMVTEDSIDTWQPAANFDFDQLAKQEILEKLKSTPTVENIQQKSCIEQKREALKAKLKNHGNLSSTKTITKDSKSNINKFPEKIEYKANFNEGLLSIGGKIIITPTQLIFHAHKFNIGDLTDRIFEISHISGYEKGMLTFLYISFNNGNRIKLTVWNKSEIIEQLEKRRTALLQ